jgi:hypothetical protein
VDRGEPHESGAGRPSVPDADRSLARHGLAAAIAVARREGLRFDDPVVLRDRGNLLVQLRPAPVVARVATVTGTRRRGARRPWAAPDRGARPGAATVHGDAHLDNVIQTLDGPLWNDWEDTCLAPRALDLGCMEAAASVFGDHPGPVAPALEAYGPIDAEALATFVAARGFRGTIWSVLIGP